MIIASNIITRKGIGLLVDRFTKLCYNRGILRKGNKMQNLQKQQLDSLLISVQNALDELGLDENDAVQNAFNALACAIDEIVYEESL